MVQKIALEEHFLSPEYIEPWLPTVAEMPKAKSEYLLGALTDFGERRLASMDKAGIKRAVLGLAGPGAQVQRDTAKAMRDAKASNDFGKFTACGQAYMDIYNRNPEATENDQVLYNAGVCFEEGKSIGAAITAYNTLEKYYPNSKITARAVARLGKAYGDIAFYDRAAEKLEQYAGADKKKKGYAGEKDAYEAMSNAVFFRKGIGDDAKAIDDTKYFIATFGPKKPQEAANAMFSMTGIYEKQGDGDAIIKHLRENPKQAFLD